MIRGFIDGDSLVKGLGLIKTLDPNKEFHEVESFGHSKQAILIQKRHVQFYQVTLSNGIILYMTEKARMPVIDRKGSLEIRTLKYLTSYDYLCYYVNLDYQPFHIESPLNKVLRDALNKKYRVEPNKGYIYEFVNCVKTNKAHKGLGYSLFVDDPFNFYTANGVVMYGTSFDTRPSIVKKTPLDKLRDKLHVK